MSPARIFIHGLESTSQGTKAVYFRKHFPGMMTDDYAGPLAARMDKLTAGLGQTSGIIMVGSSYGGLMAAIYACRHPERVKRLILLAPALSLPEFDPYRQSRLEMPVTLYHGRLDEIVPPDEVRHIAETICVQLTYHLVDDDHPLSHVFPGLPWEDLLKDC